MSVIAADTLKTRVVGAAVTTEQGLNVGGATTIAGTLEVTGAVTASSFSGDGSSITGLANTDFINATQLRVIGVTTAVGGIELGAAGVGGTVTGTGQAEFVGVVTASQFVGDGALLTGLPASFTELDAMLFN